MTHRIVADSAADLLTLSLTPFSSVPLKITAGEHTYVDDETLDVSGMVDALRAFKGRSRTACPSPDEWLAAFGDAENVFCVSITSTLSGSHNAACVAAREYQDKFPGRRVLVIDSLSAGPGMLLLVEKLEELIQQGLDFDAIAQAMADYQKTTHLVFVLESLRNFVSNGRVSPAVGALAGLLGIRIVGIASAAGDLKPIAKCRSAKKALAEIVENLRERGFSGGKVRISHCRNENAAQALKEAILTAWPRAEVIIRRTRALCSYYAEEGGVLVGFESA